MQATPIAPFPFSPCLKRKSSNERRVLRKPPKRSLYTSKSRTKKKKKVGGSRTGALLLSHVTKLPGTAVKHAKHQLKFNPTLAAPR